MYGVPPATRLLTKLLESLSIMLICRAYPISPHGACAMGALLSQVSVCGSQASTILKDEYGAVES